LALVQFGIPPRSVSALTAKPNAAVMTEHLSVQSLRVQYGRQIAVDGVSFAAAKGELLTLLGPSGCGKTTILRCIAGFVPPISGKILVADRDIARLAPHRRNIAMMFQSYALFPHLTVLENVAFGLRMRSVRRLEREKRAIAALDMVGLGEFASRYPSQLSGGQQQRVALARAIVIEPAILLLDEPLSNLDANLRAELRQEIRKLQKMLAMTTLFVTHDQQEALAVSDRIAILNQGRLIEIGTPKALCESPQQSFAAGFIGARTVIAGRTSGGMFEAPGIACTGAPEGATAIVLRAPRLRFGGQGPLSIRGRVVSATYLGDQFEVEIDASGQRIKLVTASENPPPPVGSACIVTASERAISFIVA
jgi:putative spermidine/putrescine transport system ATP-binding protein